MPTHYIQAYCHCRNNNVVYNHQSIFTSTEKVDFLKGLYQHLNLDYPKFFKMDNLCKLAFLTAETLLTHTSIKVDPLHTSMVISNASSTLDTDSKHQNSIQNVEHFFPSPAVFVYTLPNILIGEICIRHGIKGENTFFITEKFNSNLLAEYARILLKNPQNQLTILGWAEYTNTHYDCFFALINTDKTELSIELTPESLNGLYHSIG